MTARALVSSEQIARWEAEMRAAVATALAAQRARILSVSRAHGLVAAGMVGRAIGAWSPNDWAAAVNDHIAPVARRIASEVTKTVSDSVPPNAIRGIADRASAIAGRMVDTATAAGEAIAGRVAAALSTSDVAGAIDAVFSGAERGLGDMIARQASGAVNEWTDAIAKHAAARGWRDVTRTWTSQADDRVRPDHEDADGQTVGPNEAFDVGGELLMFPGDPAGSEAQTANCRCILMIDGLDDQSENGVTPQVIADHISGDGGSSSEQVGDIIGGDAVTDAVP